jgi:molybdopterin converting factor small subunit
VTPAARGPGRLARLARRLRREAPGALRVRVIVRGRIGPGWYDVDERLWLPAGATLAALLEEAERRGLRVRAALEQSPHLADTLMLNGERCPVEANLGRPLADGDEVYLLGPLAGG